MPGIRIETDFARLERDLKRVDSKLYDRAVPPAVNRVAGTVRTRATRDLSKRLGAKARDVRSKLEIRKARRGSVIAYVDAEAGRALNLIKFVTPRGAQPSKPGSPNMFRRRKARGGGYTRKGVQAKAWNQRKVYEGTFVARGRGNNVLVFARKGGDRRARLKSIHGPSIRREFRSQESRQQLNRTANERLPIELDRSIQNQLRRLRK